MSSTLGVQRWFRESADLPASPAELSRHAREFGFTFVSDDDTVKQECPALPPVPPLIPLGEAAGRRMRVSGDIDCDDSGGSGGDAPGRYGGVIMVNSDARNSDDEDKLLRLFGGGDSDASSVGVEVRGPSHVCGGASEGKGACEGRCSVLLDPLPSDLLRSLNSDGRVSAERVEQGVAESSSAGAGSVEVHGLLQDLVSAVAHREERECRRPARSQRQDAAAGSRAGAAAAARPRPAGAGREPPPPPLGIDAAEPTPPAAAEPAAAAVSRDVGPQADAPSRKGRHRKSDSPRKAVRRRRERRSSSSGGGGAVAKKHRKRSTSTCSTTSSNCSNSSIPRPHHHHKHHHRHHKHRRRSGPVAEEPPPTPRVNPIFVWIKQDDTRIVEVLCEDYDKRNRIRLTKTAHGWRAMPRTERLASSTVTSCDLPKLQQLPSQEIPSAERSPAVGSPPPPELGAADAGAGSSSPGRREALGEEQSQSLRPGGSTSDENIATSLVPSTFPECPISEEGHMDEQEAKEDEEEMEEEEEGEPVHNGVDDLQELETAHSKDVMEAEDGECEKEVDDEIQDEEDNPEENVVDKNVENEEEDEENIETHVNNIENVNEADSQVLLEDDSLPPEDHEGQLVENEKEANLETKLEKTESELSQEPQESLEEKCEMPVESEQCEGGEETVAEEADASENADDDDDDDDEVIAPTDLSLPKVESQEDDLPLNCTKNIPRNISTVIPPVVPSPQPRPSPTYPPAAPAHQTKHTSKFLESLLSSPRKCHEVPRRSSSETEKGPAPLDLGVSSSNRGAGSPTVSCSDETRKMSRPAKEPAEGEPKVKVMKVEDITLKNLLSRQPDANTRPSDIDLSSTGKKEEVVESGRKSRLLELLTSEPSAAVSPSSAVDPLTQLKKVLSDPEITVPDPLLVPRDRLQELVANPAREIPRLLTMRPELRLPEALAYPTLLSDPDLLVVSLSHLQSLLQKSEKSVKEDNTANYNNLGTILDWQKYQNQHQAAMAKELLDAQLKHQHQQHHHQQQSQSQQDADAAAAAAALNQMLWLPYLTQLEAAAVSCGNNQDFLNLLTAVFPTSYTQAGQPPPPPYPFLAAMNPSVFNISPTDYKSQMEFQNAFLVWQEMMVQANAANSLNNNNTTTSNNNHRTMKVPSNNNVSKSATNNTNGRYPPQSSRKYNSTSSARTSPLTPNNYHSPSPAPSPHRATPVSSLPASPYHPGSGAYATTSQLHHQYNLQRCRSNGTASVPAPKQPKVADLHLDAKNGSSRSSVNGKSLFNLLSGPTLHDAVQAHHLSSHPLASPPGTTARQQHSHLLAALGKPSSTNTPVPPVSPSLPPLVPLPPSPLDLSGATKKAPTPKLKVKDHLVDPSHTPKLLKADPSPEVGSTTPHPHLWHPLFGSQKTSLNSPWSWTTVTVNGE